MIKRRSQILCAWFLLWDLIITALAWIGAYYIRFEFGLIPVRTRHPDVSICWRNLPLVLLLAAVAYHLVGQYSIHRLRRFREEVIGVFKGTVQHPVDAAHRFCRVSLFLLLRIQFLNSLR